MSITKPQEGFLCQMCLNSVFTQTTYTQDRFRHVHHMEIVPFRLTTNFQPDLSLSVFLERFSVCSSETSCTIRLFQFGVPKPLGTHVDRGSAVDHHQTFMGSWVPLLAVCSWVLGSQSLAVCSWVLGSQSLAVFLSQFYSLRNHFGSSLRH